MSIETVKIVGTLDTSTPGTVTLIGFLSPWGTFTSGPLSPRDIAILKMRLYYDTLQRAVRAAITATLNDGASAEA